MVKRSPSERLLERYIPGAILRIKWGGRRTESVSVDDEAGTITVRWNPASGFTTLLHEIGHYRLRHHGPAQLERELIAPKASTILAEVAAWLWAERAARRHRLTFDYDRANRAFRTYTRDVQIAWRHGP